jgi:hypothetical protein
MFQMKIYSTNDYQTNHKKPYLYLRVCCLF